MGLLSLLPPTSKFGWPWTIQTNPEIYSAKKNWPKITIVTPSYNQANFLEQTIRSVLLQNYPNVEFIIIDGGSTDGSAEIIKKYSPWISYWQSEKDGGQGNAINQGFSLSSGDIHAWINSDDYYTQDAFFKVANAFIKRRVDFVYGFAQTFNTSTNKVETVKVMPHSDYFIKMPNLAQPSCFWTSKIHQPIWEELHCALDYELWLRLLKGQKRKRIREVLSVANVHDDAKTHDPKIKDRWHQDHLKIWSEDGHGPVPEWKRVALLDRIRKKIYRTFNWI
ncbi:glycosyltransferase [Mucilaginibacter pallidiroseus]|uniref:Glycosyltransferase n=1 Tax=Mucilaginibacter pallidiroseus TaxID=2599295 RepID=A0A563U2F7_9SPHI|nr:glycosyltransferase [Mucilaginibacter pallidiroseus]